MSLLNIITLSYEIADINYFISMFITCSFITLIPVLVMISPRAAYGQGQH